MKKTLSSIVIGAFLLTSTPVNAITPDYSIVEKDEAYITVGGRITRPDNDKNDHLNFEITQKDKKKIEIQSLCNGNHAELDTIRDIINNLYKGTYFQDGEKRDYTLIEIMGDYTKHKGKKVFEIKTGNEGGILLYYTNGKIHYLPIV